MNLLDSFVLRMSVSGAIMADCTSCKMEHHHILLCPFVRGFTTVLLVGGFGVEGQHGRRENLYLIQYDFAV
jgi:hypothetical protein